jgi:hypothetical protein
MKIVLTVFALFGLGGCSTSSPFLFNQNDGAPIDASIPSTSVLQRISIISAAEEAQLAEAVARARELHAQIRAYDAAIAAATQRKLQLESDSARAKANTSSNNEVLRKLGVATTLRQQKAISISVDYGADELRVVHDHKKVVSQARVHAFQSNQRRAPSPNQTVAISAKTRLHHSMIERSPPRVMRTSNCTTCRTSPL